MTTPSKVYQYSVGFNLTSVYTTNLEFETSFTTALSIDGVIYIGTTDYGVLKSKAMSVSEYDEIHPQ